MSEKFSKKDLRILFMGTPDISKRCLDTLVENGYNVVGVFCQPDKPKGRGLEICEPPVKQCAVKNGILVCQLPKLRNEPIVEEVLNEMRPNLIIVSAYGKILPKNVLDFPKYGCINVHYSLLPKFRGAAPIQWAIMNSENETGITTMYMDEGMDTGNIIMQEKMKIESDDTYGTLHDKLMELGAETLIKTLDILVEHEGYAKSTPQSDNFTIAPMISKEGSKIDFDYTVQSVVDLVRGLNPFPAAWCKLDDERVYKIYKVERIDFYTEKKYEQGQIACLNDKKNLFVVRCKDGYINIVRIKPAGSREMTAGEYIRSGKVKEGEIFI